MKDCPYCRLIAGELNAAFVYQDQVCSALMSMQPINPGHLILIPNEHLKKLDEIPLEIGAHLFQTSQELGQALRGSGIQCEGIDLYLVEGKASGSGVPHLHIHLIPRYEGDGFEFQFSARYAELPTREELEKNARHIEAALEKTGGKD